MVIPRFARIALPLLALAQGSPLVADLAIEPIRSALQPDLVIVDAQVAPANPNRLRVRVANQGLAPAAETRIELVYRRASRETAMSAAVPFLETGERQWLIFEVGAPLAEADEIRLRIDEPHRVIESNELNNGFVFRRG